MNSHIQSCNNGEEADLRFNRVFVDKVNAESPSLLRIAPTLAAYICQLPPLALIQLIPTTWVNRRLLCAVTTTYDILDIMALRTSLIATISALMPLSTQVNVDFFTHVDCLLEYGTIMTPSEIGCRALNAREVTLLSVKTGTALGPDCVVELYVDESCNSLGAVLDDETSRKCYHSPPIVGQLLTAVHCKADICLNVNAGSDGFKAYIVSGC
jgi:hypothetical protein